MPPIPTIAPAAPPATATTATLPAQSLPPVPPIASDAATLARISPPVKRIHTDADTQQWIHSEAHRVYSLFVQRIAEACVGKPTRPLPPPPPPPPPTVAAVAAPADSVVAPLQRLVRLLHTLNSWTDEIEPQSKPQRFGNLAFRDWGARLEHNVDQLHAELLDQRWHPFIPELSAYLLESFGSFVRIDYGSGHEFCFASWLCFLYRLGFFGDDAEIAAHAHNDNQPLPPTQSEESLGLEILPLYLHVVWRLQDRYGLEPAGSHGVWGLDDYHFLPYVFGAAQLRSQSALRPAQIVAASSHPKLLASLPDTTPRSLIAYPPSVPEALLVRSSSGSSLALPNLYLTSLLRIQVLKRGPFHEHSPLLHDISTSVPNWIKTYGGMVKMYEAECLNKRVVVQHFKFGGVGWQWPEHSGGSSSSGNGGGGGGSATSTGMPTWSVAGMAGQTGPLALGVERGNASSMGVPTARRTAAPPQPVVGGGRLSASLFPTAATSRLPTGPGPTTTAPTRAPGFGIAATRTTTMPPPPQPGARPGRAAASPAAAPLRPTATATSTITITRSAPAPAPGVTPSQQPLHNLAGAPCASSTSASRAGPTAAPRPS
ncbi:Serine/threonine-protein phosphatase 2A activator 1 [Thecaphora frezii]